ncbi:hypothetical protein TraAM80_09779 [Trypanosoma rangeli]|uniref:Uncharacterized protein n=1 Tax=Trypanosoma rangeli TaxID=5698 RepID=A0A422MTD1_TRYRA|nr:uncharacterized protein TraAM80_09779 [Trypanosoma rangeli]RNE96464.1 hypothetical protein TraAM80_09779 [Trypanosoma rangeli]|eukprot:RNE96464.1 hypothetical protein TraAM80_09779 [Trypanosoma rangeli]
MSGAGQHLLFGELQFHSLWPSREGRRPHSRRSASSNSPGTHPRTAFSSPLAFIRNNPATALQRRKPLFGCGTALRVGALAKQGTPAPHTCSPSPKKKKQQNPKRRAGRLSHASAAAHKLTAPAHRHPNSRALHLDTASPRSTASSWTPPLRSKRAVCRTVALGSKTQISSICSADQLPHELQYAAASFLQPNHHDLSVTCTLARATPPQSSACASSGVHAAPLDEWH